LDAGQLVGVDAAPSALAMICISVTRASPKIARP
jgi:hypothetical protein